MVVVDASAFFLMLVGRDREAEWIRERLGADVVAAPSLLHFEVANTLRRHVVAALLPPEAAEWAHAQVATARILTAPYSLIASGVWALRQNYTLFDASYLALGALLGAPVLTADHRLARGPNLPCEVLTYPGDA